MKRIIFLLSFFLMSILLITSCNKEEDLNFDKKNQDFISAEFDLTTDEQGSINRNPCNITLPCDPIYTGNGCAIPLNNDFVFHYFNDLVRNINQKCELSSINISVVGAPLVYIPGHQGNPNISLGTGGGGPTQTGTPNGVVIPCDGTVQLVITITSNCENLILPCTSYNLSCPVECCGGEPCSSDCVPTITIGQNCTVIANTDHCDDTNLTLNWTLANGTVGGNWPVQDASTPGTYCVTVTDSDGCTASTCVGVEGCEIVPCVSECLPIIVLRDDCNVEAITDHCDDPNLTLSWTLANGTPGGNWHVQDASTPGVYCVTVTDSDGCTASTCIEVDDCHIVEPCNLPPCSDAVSTFGHWDAQAIDLIELLDCNGNVMSDFNGVLLAGLRPPCTIQDAYAAATQVGLNGTVGTGVGPLLPFTGGTFNSPQGASNELLHELTEIPGCENATVNVINTGDGFDIQVNADPCDCPVNAVRFIEYEWIWNGCNSSPAFFHNFTEELDCITCP